MMLRAIVLTTLVALVSVTVALKWEQCENLDTTILKVEVDGCDNSQDVCEISSLYANITVDFIQLSKSMSENQIIAAEYDEDLWEEQSGHCGCNLVYPGRQGQLQSLVFAANAKYDPEHLNRTLRLTLLEEGRAVPQVCVDIPVRILPKYSIPSAQE